MDKLIGIRQRYLHVTSWAHVMVGWILFMLMGVVGNEGMHRFYVVLPYVLMFVPLSLLVIYVGRLVMIPGKMTHAQYCHCVRGIRRCIRGILTLAHTIFFAQMGFMFLDGGIGIGPDMVFLIATMGLTAAFLGFWDVQRLLSV